MGFVATDALGVGRQQRGGAVARRGPDSLQQIMPGSGGGGGQQMN